MILSRLLSPVSAAIGMHAKAFLASAALRMQPRWARLYYMSAALSSQEIREEEREA